MSYNATDTWLCLEHILILWQKHLSGLLWVTIVTCSPASEVIINNAIEFWEVLISKNIKVLGSNSLILEWFLVHTHPTSDCCLESSFLFFFVALSCGGSSFWKALPVDSSQEFIMFGNDPPGCERIRKTSDGFVKSTEAASLVIQVAMGFRIHADLKQKD